MRSPMSQRVPGVLHGTPDSFGLEGDLGMELGASRGWRWGTEVVGVAGRGQ